MYILTPNFYVYTTVICIVILLSANYYNSNLSLYNIVPSKKKNDSDIHLISIAKIALIHEKTGI